MFHSKRNLKNHAVLFGYLIGIATLGLLAFYYWQPLVQMYTNPDEIRTFIEGFGIFGPLVFIFFQFLQVIIFFVPGAVFTIAGGYLFGTFVGTVYSIIGTMIGSILVFLVSRKYGRPFVEKIVHRKELQHFDAFFKKRGKISIVITRMVPVIFPNDAVSMAAGITPIKFRDYVLYSIIGFIPHLFLLNYFGVELTKEFNPSTVIILTLVGLSGMAYIFRHPIKVFFIKEIRELEADLRKVEEVSVKEVAVIEEAVEREYDEVVEEIKIVEGE